MRKEANQNRPHRRPGWKVEERDADPEVLPARQQATDNSPAAGYETGIRTRAAHRKPSRLLAGHAAGTVRIRRWMIEGTARTVHRKALAEPVRAGRMILETNTMDQKWQ